MKTMLGAQAFSNLVTMLDQLVELFGEDIVGPLRDLFSKLLGENGRRWVEEFKKFGRGEICWAAFKLSNLYFDPAIASGMLGATTGQDLWARVIKFFTGGVDSDFVNWGLTDDQAPTTETPFTVLPLKKNGRFAEIFEGFNLDLNLLAWKSFDQVMAFAMDHVGKLHFKGYGIFFLCQVDGKFFVVRVDWRVGGQMRLSIRHWSNECVWYAENRYRFVFPQQP